MKKYKKLLSLLFLLSFILQGFLVSPVKSEEASKNIILLIDNSGSMKQTDPKRLSIIAASMLIDSIDDNTNINIIPFGDKPSSLYRLDSKPTKQDLKAELSSIKFDSNYTDAKEGLKEALLQLSGLQGDKSIIILSDGKEDPIGGLTKEHTDEFNSLIERAHSEGIRVNCIGLSEAADKDSLGNIAFKTGGEFYYSSNPSELFNVYSKLLGSINDFYIVQEDEMEEQASKEVKLSSYVQEVIIKIASFDNKTPLISIIENNKELMASKLGDGYKIYNFKNEGDNTINILSKDKGKYLLIVQVKSKAKLNINSTDKNFSVPNEVPMDINVSLDVDNEIMGLHMDKLEGDIREPIDKNKSNFSFIFKKDKSGQYPILITAYDGQGGIIAVNNLNINVTDYPPFYYTSQVPSEMILDKPYKIELKQLNNLKVINPSGEIVVDYGDKYEEFPLKIVDNILTTEVTLHKQQGVKLTTCINGVYNKENFSYYLPYFKIKAVEKPFVELEAAQTKKVVKQNETVELKLNIKASKLYNNEKIYIYDIKNNKLGEFTLVPDTKVSTISATIKAKELGKNITLKLKSDEGIKITEIVNTKITVLSKLSYYYEPFKIPVYFILFLSLLILILNTFVKYQYKKYEAYTITKELTYKLDSTGTNYFLALTLSPEENTQYMNLRNSNIVVEDEGKNEIGYLILSLPKGTKTIKSLKYFILKDKAFSVEYYPSMEQQVYKEDEEINGSLQYEGDIRIFIKSKKEGITIYFS